MANFRPRKPEPKDVTFTHPDGSSDTYTQSETLVKFWGLSDQLALEHGHPNPLRNMAAVRAFISCDRPLPKDLKKWFLDGLAQHEKHEGEKKLDEIYGFTNEEHQRSALTKSKAELPSLVSLVTILKTAVDISVSSAARLAVWYRESAIDPESVARKYRDQEDKISYLHDNVDYREHDLKILKSFTELANSLDTGDVVKDIAKLQKAVEFISAKNPEEYYEYLTTGKNAD